MTPEEIVALQNDPTPYEIVTLSDGRQAKARSLNNVSDEARKKLNITYTNLIKQGLA